MWVKGSPLQFLVDSGSQKNLISAEVVKWLYLPTLAHLQPYTIGWLHPGRDIYIRQQCCLPYNIKPFTDEVLCDVAPLDVADVLLGLLATYKIFYTKKWLDFVLKNFKRQFALKTYHILKFL